VSLVVVLLTSDPVFDRSRNASNVRVNQTVLNCCPRSIAQSQTGCFIRRSCAATGYPTDTALTTFLTVLGILLAMRRELFMTLMVLVESKGSLGRHMF